MEHEYYDWSSLINYQSRQQMVKDVKHLIDGGSYWTNSPKYQTNVNVFGLSSEDWVNLKMSFIWSCFAYLGREVQIKNIQSWSFMTQKDSAENRDALWHHHNHNTDTTTISGVFYLYLPITEENNLEFSGTELAPNGVNGDGKYYTPWRDANWMIYPGETWHRPGKLYSPHSRFVVAADMEF